MANDVERDNQDVVDGEAVEVTYDMPVAQAASSSTAIVARGEISVNDLVEQHEKITQAMEIAMQDGHHYGVIPGTNKPSLLKPGAEKLCVLFRLAPSYQSEKIWHEGSNHLTVVASCTLTHIPTGLVIATGEGLCSTKEARYAQRTAGRVCPACGSDAIIKGKAEYGGGWLCYKKKGGCGAKFDDHDPAIVNQESGKAEVDDAELPNVWNTVLKMADKRALVAAILNGTAASDVFTQDMEDAPQQAAPAAAREFDPGVDLLPGAPARSKDRMKKLGSMMQYVGPTVDWPQLGADLREGLYGEPDLTLLSKAAFNDFTNRICNAVAKVTGTMTGDFPPPEDSEIKEALAWAFDGILISTIPHLDPEPEEADNDDASGGDTE